MIFKDSERRFIMDHTHRLPLSHWHSQNPATPNFSASTRMIRLGRDLPAPRRRGCSRLIQAGFPHRIIIWMPPNHLLLQSCRAYPPVAHWSILNKPYYEWAVFQAPVVRETCPSILARRPGRVSSIIPWRHVDSGIHIAGPSRLARDLARRDKISGAFRAAGYSGREK